MQATAVYWEFQYHTWLSFKVSFTSFVYLQPTTQYNTFGCTEVQMANPFET